MNNIYELYIMLSINYKLLCFIIEYILKCGLCKWKENVFFPPMQWKEYNKFEHLNLTNKNKLMIKRNVKDMLKGYAL